MTPEQLELLKKYRISIPPDIKCTSYPASKLFDFLPKNNGLTEEYIYNNSNPLSLQLPVYTASYESIGSLPIDFQKGGKPLKMCMGEVIVIFRQGYAGLMYIPKEDMFFASEHTIPIKVKDQYKAFVNQHWFIKYYQPDVMHYVTGKADSGNYSALAFEKMSFLIPEKWWQDECAELYKKLDAELEKVGKNIAGLSISKPTNRGLSDAELAAKYDNDKPIDFDTALKKLATKPSVTAKNKAR